MANRITEEWAGKKSSTKKGIRWSKCLGGEPTFEQEHFEQEHFGSIESALQGSVLHPVPIHPMPYDKNISIGLVPAVQAGTVMLGPSVYSTVADSVRLRALEAKVYAMDAELRSLRADHSRRIADQPMSGAASHRLEEILALTRKIFDKQISPRIEQRFDQDSGDPVVTVWVIEDTDVEEVTQRQIMWHERLAQTAPEAAGAVSLVIAFE